MSWLLGVVGTDDRIGARMLERTRTLARRGPGFLFECVPAGGGYLAGGGLPDTLCHNADAGWAVAGAGLRVEAGRTRILAATDWGATLQPPQPDLAHLDGHFAAFRWGRDGFFAATDALGLRALYHATCDGYLVISTRQDWVAALAGRDRLNAAAFGTHWLFFNQMSSDALVKGVRRLGAGGTLRYHQEKLEVDHRPWLPDAGAGAFEDTLAALVMPVDNRHPGVSIGLSGGLDSRLLLAMRTSQTTTRAHAFGPAALPDVRLAQRLADALDVPLARFHEPLPDADACLRLLRDHAVQTHAIAPASTVMGLRYYDALRGDGGNLMIDGGFGEVARQQYLNRLRLRGRTAMARRSAVGVAPYVLHLRTSVFAADAQRTYWEGAMEGLQSALTALPPDFGVDDAIDLLSIRTRLPNFFGYEQSRLDGHILNYMPFAQPRFLSAVFGLRMADRRHGRAFRRLIAARQPALTRYPLVKGTQTYPYGLPPLPAYLWTTIARRFGKPRAPAVREAFLDRVAPYARDRVRDRGVRDDARYDYDRLRELVDGYYDGRHRRAGELDWWLALDAWWQRLGGGD